MYLGGSRSGKSTLLDPNYFFLSPRPLNLSEIQVYEFYRTMNRFYGKGAVMEMDAVSKYPEIETLKMVEKRMKKLQIKLESLKNRRDSLYDAGNDEYDDGTVIRFVKPVVIRGIARDLVYAAIKKQNAWFVTGASGINDVSWERLVQWAGADNIAKREIVDSWYKLYGNGSE